MTTNILRHLEGTYQTGSLALILPFSNPEHPKPKKNISLVSTLDCLDASLLGKIQLDSFYAAMQNRGTAPVGFPIKIGGFEFYEVPLLHFPAYLGFETGRSPENLPTIIQEARALLLPCLTNKLVDFDLDKVIAIPDKEKLIQLFTDHLATILFPLKMPVNDNPPQIHWSNGELGTRAKKTFSIPFGDDNLVRFSFLVKKEKQQQATGFVQISHFFVAAQNFFTTVLAVWQAQHAGANAPLVSGELIDAVRKNRETLTQMAQLHKQQEEQLAALMRQAAADHLPVKDDFSFYKGTLDWVIYFKGQPISLKKKNETGLRYIHKMLLQPGKVFFPNDLEAVSLNGPKADLIQISQSMSVEVSSRFASLNPENEDELLKSLRQMTTEKPGNFDAIEKHIYYLSQIVFLSHCLKNLTMKRAYIELFNAYKGELDDLIFKFNQETEDKDFVRKILTKSRIIKKPIEHNVQNRRLRQRVTKSIKNALNNIDSDELTAYFKLTLAVGVRSSYTPLPDQPVDWKLYLD